ncbi:hypothetical protein Tco_0317423 [Tanacetum coccineum]
MDRGTTNVPYLLAQYLFMHAEGRKSRARLFGGHFIGRLADHFGIVSDEGLRGLFVISRELPVIDLHELARLNICGRFGDTWAWVAPGLERQQVAAAGAHEADEAGSVVDEGAQDVPGPEQAPYLHSLLSPGLCHRGLRGSRRRCVIYGTIGHTYQAFDSTLVGSSRMPYQRCVRPRTGDVSTSAAPHTDDQPDP